MKLFILLSLMLFFPLCIPALPNFEIFDSEKKPKVEEVEKTKVDKKTKKVWKKELRKSKAKKDSKGGAVFLTILAGIAAMALLTFGLFLLDAAVGLGTFLGLFTLVGIGVIIYFMVKIIKNVLKNPSGG